MKVHILVGALALATFAMPAANAEPQCLQVYPWSELCQGNVDGFVEATLCEGTLGCPSLACIAMDPWWSLCQGDVAGFVGYFTDNIVLS